MVSAGVIIALVICCVLVIVGTVLGVYFSKVACPDFGSECTTSPSPGPRSPGPAPKSPGPAPKSPGPAPKSPGPAPKSPGPAPGPQSPAPAPAPAPATATSPPVGASPTGTSTGAPLVFTASTPPAQVVAALQALSPTGQIDLTQLGVATQPQIQAVQAAYLTQCQLGSYEIQACNAPCGGFAGQSIGGYGRIGGGTENCPAEIRTVYPCVSAACPTPGITVTEEVVAGGSATVQTVDATGEECVVSGYVGGASSRCCAGSSYNDDECIAPSGYVDTATPNQPQPDSEE